MATMSGLRRLRMPGTRNLDRDFVRAALSVAVPAMLQQLITSFVNLLDNLMVGQLSEHAISAVAAANRFFMIGFMAVIGVTSAASIYLAQFHGADNVESQKESFRYTLLSAALAFLPFLLAALLLPRQIIAFFNRDPGLVEPGLAYLPIVGIAFIPTIISWSCQSSMRALGYTRLPLLITASTVMLNALWNWILIFGHFGFPALGVQGAALGTLIARVAELIVTLIAMHRSRFVFSTRLRDLFRIPRRLVAAITKRALPLMLNEIGFSSGLALLFRFYATRGTSAMAAMTIMQTTTDLFFVLFGGMAATTTVLVSQPLGRGDLERARSNAYKLVTFSMLLAMLLGVGLFIVSFITPQLYNVAQDVRDLAANFIRMQAFFFWVYMRNTQAFFILRSGGDTRNTLILDTGYMFGVNIPIVAIITYLTQLPVFFIYLAGQSTDIVKLFISRRFLRRETWLVNLAADHAADHGEEPVRTAPDYLGEEAVAEELEQIDVLEPEGGPMP